MYFKTFRSEGLPHFRNVSLVCVGAHLDVIGLRPQEIFVNQYGMKTELSQFVDRIVRPGLVLKRPHLEVKFGCLRLVATSLWLARRYNLREGHIGESA